jgi:hypothetical protein
VGVPQIICLEARTHEVGPNLVGRRNSDIFSPLPPSLGRRKSLVRVAGTQITLLHGRKCLSISSGITWHRLQYIENIRLEFVIQQSIFENAHASKWRELSLPLFDKSGEFSQVVSNNSRAADELLLMLEGSKPR